VDARRGQLARARARRRARALRGSLVRVMLRLESAGPAADRSQRHSLTASRVQHAALVQVPFSHSILGLSGRAPVVPTPSTTVDMRVRALIGVVALSATAAIGLALPTVVHTAAADPRRVASMLALTLVLQLF